jgi:hypothetical protein
MIEVAAQAVTSGNGRHGSGNAPHRTAAEIAR